MDKVIQESVIKKSKIDGGRPLDPQFHVDAKGHIVSEQEIIERQKLREELEKKAADRDARLARWKGKSPPEILCAELERIRPGTVTDSTFSIHPLATGDIDVHLFGRVFRVLAHVVKHSNKSATWHITAKGCLDRLKTAAVRPDAPKQVKQAELYQEQADILRELARVAGVLDDEVLQAQLVPLSEVKDEAVRWKAEVNALFIHLRQKLGEMRCLTSPQPPPQSPMEPPPKVEKPKGRPPRRRRRPKADPSPKATPEVSAAEDSPTT